MGTVSGRTGSKSRCEAFTETQQVNSATGEERPVKICEELAEEQLHKQSALGQPPCGAGVGDLSPASSTPAPPGVVADEPEEGLSPIARYEAKISSGSRTRSLSPNVAEAQSRTDPSEPVRKQKRQRRTSSLRHTAHVSKVPTPQQKARIKNVDGIVSLDNDKEKVNSDACNEGNRKSCAEAAIAAMPRQWIEKLGDTLTLHTIQNAMQLIQYLHQILKDGYGTASALHIACWQGSVDAVSAITSGSQGREKVRQWHSRPGELAPLHIATICGHCDVVEYLLELEADPNLPTVHGLRPLHIAATSSIEICDALLSGRANPEQKTADGDMPLHFACSFHQVSIIELLLRGVDTGKWGGGPAIASTMASRANTWGTQPLHLAVAYAALAGVPAIDARVPLVLFDYGVDPCARDLHGVSPQDIVKMAEGHQSLIDFLTADRDKVSRKARELLAKADIAVEEELVSKPKTRTQGIRPCSQSASRPSIRSGMHDTANSKARGSGDMCETETSSSNGSVASRLSAAAGSATLVNEEVRVRKDGSEEFRLSEENAILTNEVAKLSKSLEDAVSREKLQVELLAHSKDMMEQLKTASATSQTYLQHQNNEALQSMKAELELELNRLTNKCTTLESENHKLREENNCIKRERDEAVISAQQVSEATAQQASGAAEASAALADELEALREKNLQLQGELGNAENVIRAKSAEYETLAKALSDVEAQRDDAMNAVRRASEEAAKYMEETHATSATAKQMEAAQAAAAALLVQKDLELSQKDEEITRTHADIARKDGEIIRQRAEIEGKDEEMNRKKSDINRKDNDLIALRSKLASTEYELNEQRESVNRLREESRQLGKDLESRSAERHHLEDSLLRLREEHHQLQEQRGQLQQEHSQLLQSSQQAESAAREREMIMEGRVREQELQLEKLTHDNSEYSQQLEEMDAYRERAAYADRMLKPLEHRIEELHAAFAGEQAIRKRYHNQLQDMKGAIRVYVRVRPVAQRETGGEVAVRKMDAFQVEVANKDKNKSGKQFTFDSVFDEHATQESVFAECRGLVSSAIDGFNVTVFAYGQTGAGKTHTMYGSQTAPGLVPRIAEELFATLNCYAHEYQATVRCSMFELYCDDLLDLLLPTGKGQFPLDVKRDARGSVYVSGATERVASSKEELLKTIQDGQDRRHVASTKMNADSSRSHLIFTIGIECLNKKTKSVATGKLTLCDLAGSERLKKSQVIGDAVKEAQSINKSLSALGDVIEALSKNSKHVPYRNHKLTQLLSDSIGGNAKTLMFVNCSPVLENADETASSLSYAARAKLIVNKIEKNQDSMEVARLKKVITLMNQELEQAKNHGAPVTSNLPAPLAQGEVPPELN